MSDGALMELPLFWARNGLLSATRSITISSGSAAAPEVIGFGSKETGLP